MKPEILFLVFFHGCFSWFALLCTLFFSSYRIYTICHWTSEILSLSFFHLLYKTNLVLNHCSFVYVNDLMISVFICFWKSRKSRKTGSDWDSQIYIIYLFLDWIYWLHGFLETVHHIIILSSSKLTKRNHKICQ